MAGRFLRHIQVRLAAFDFGDPLADAVVIDADPLDPVMLTVEFDVRVESATPYPTGEIRIYNLARSTLGLLQQEYLDCQLFAGYSGGELAPIYRGSVRRVYTESRPPDVITTLFLGGDLRFREEVSLSLQDSDEVAVHVLAAFARMDVGVDGLRVARLLREPGTSTPLRLEPGYNFGPGRVADLLTDLLVSRGFFWALRSDGTGVVLPVDSVDLETYSTHIRVSGDSGLIGIPEVMIEEGRRSLEVSSERVDGVRIRSLLDSRFVLDRGFVVDSELVEGSVFRPISIVHRGGNRVRDFFTIVEGRKV